MNPASKILAILVSLCAMLLSACQVGGPAKGEGNVPALEGKSFTLRRDVILAHTGVLMRSLTAFEVDEEEDLKSRKQFDKRISAGTGIRIQRTVSKRMEPGIFHFYECGMVGSPETFLLPFSMRDSIGLAKYTEWP
jgi:hypothetical protein